MNLDKLRQIWDSHAKPVYAYLLQLTRSEADAKDFLQDVFCQLARQPALLDRLDAEPRGYLLRQARNLVVDQARRGKVRERVFAKINALRNGEAVDAEDPDNLLIQRALTDALRQLPEEQRAVVHGRLWKKQTLDAIAMAFGISINTAASRYRYGLDKMREHLRSLYEDLAPGAARHPNNSTQKISQPALHPMKNKSKIPFSGLPEEPLIQALEQRRVPSATGAVLSVLPMPDDHVDDHSAEPAPDPAVSAEPSASDAGQPNDQPDPSSADGGVIMLGEVSMATGSDPIPLDQVDVLPLTLDDVINNLDTGTGDGVTDPAAGGDGSGGVDVTWAVSEVYDSSTDGGGDPLIDNVTCYHEDPLPVVDGGEVADGEITDGSDPNIFHVMNFGGVLNDGSTDHTADVGSVDHSLDGTLADATPVDHSIDGEFTDATGPNVFHPLNPDALNPGEVTDGEVTDHATGPILADGPHDGQFVILNDGDTGHTADDGSVDHSADGTLEGTTSVDHSTVGEITGDATGPNVFHPLNPDSLNPGEVSLSGTDGSGSDGFHVINYGGVLTADGTSADHSVDGHSPTDTASAAPGLAHQDVATATAGTHSDSAGLAHDHADAPTEVHHEAAATPTATTTAENASPLFLAGGDNDHSIDSHHDTAAQFAPIIDLHAPVTAAHDADAHVPAEHEVAPLDLGSAHLAFEDHAADHDTASHSVGDHATATATVDQWAPVEDFSSDHLAALDHDHADIGAHGDLSHSHDADHHEDFLSDHLAVLDHDHADTSAHGNLSHSHDTDHHEDFSSDRLAPLNHDYAYASAHGESSHSHDTDHQSDHSIAPADAGAVSGDTHSTMRGSSVAMAATGAAMVSGDAKPTDRKKRE